MADSDLAKNPLSAPLPARQVVDPHVHFFDLQAGHYHWLKAGQAPFWPDKDRLRHDVSEADLILPADLALQGFVHIEAGFDNQQTWREIDWLAQHCNGHYKSVACADLCSDTFSEQLCHLQQRPSVVGIRHILDDEAVTILSDHRIPQHFALLSVLNWSFDAQLPLTDTFCSDALFDLASSFPAVNFILNHAGWPPSEQHKTLWQRWRINLTKLSQLPNIALKLSGWEMSDRQYSSERISKVTQTTLAILGESRVMLASNFPLCRLSCSYEQLWQQYTRILAVDDHCLEKLVAKNALHWYQFD